MSMLDRAEPGRRMCPVIFLLDTSGSMSGAPIGAVNAAMEGVLPELISMNSNNPDAEIVIAVLKFDTDTAWVTGEGGLVKPEDYAWNPLDAAGVTSMGAAFGALVKVLSVSSGFMNRASGSVAPVLFLLSDGEPTDNYQEKLQVLKGNNWYKVAARVAIGYGESNDDVLREFTGNSETVLHTNDPKDLQKLIRFVTITSSMVASTGKGVATQGNESTVADPNDMTNAVAQTLKTAPPMLSTSTDPDEVWD